MSEQTCCDKNRSEQFTCGQLRLEIDRLKGELEESNVDLDRAVGANNLFSIQVYNLERQLAEARAEVLKYRAAATVDTDELFETQKALSEARTENGRLEKCIETERLLYYDGLSKARQEAAREILRIISIETIDRQFEQSQAAEIIRQRFGLEG